MNPESLNYIDVHTHVNFSAFDHDREEVIKRSLDAGVGMINVGTQKDTSQKAVELAEKYDGVYAIIGLHPIHTDKSFHDDKELGEGGKEFTSRGETFDHDFYKKLATHPKAVAIGECGLDFYRITNNESGITNENVRKKQEDIFRKHIELALEVDKPLMLHIRNAYTESLSILKSYIVNRDSTLRGDVHFFAGTWEEAKLFLDLGFTLSFTGVITFTHDYDEVIRNTPLNMILSETDAPYVAPIPYRGKRNEPLYVREVVAKIAEIKGLPLEEVKKAMLENAKRAFSL